MHAIDVLHVVAAIGVGFLAIRGGQAIAEHYFPNTEGVAAARFLFGGPR